MRGFEGTWAQFQSPNLNSDGTGGQAAFNAWVSASNGLIYSGAVTRIASITDGTSNTLFFGERAHGILGGSDAPFFMWWNSGYWGDTFCRRLVPDQRPPNAVGSAGPQ